MKKLSFFIILFLFQSCAEGEKGEDIIENEIKEITDISDTETDFYEKKEININENFRIVYGYRGRITAGPEKNTDKHDLWLLNPLKYKEEPLNLTKFALQNIKDLNCDKGCIIDRNLTWIAVSTTGMTPKGADYKIGKFNNELIVSLVKWAVLKEKKYLAFAGNYLYYSELVDCTGSPQSCYYDIHRVNLENPSDKQKITTFPPMEELKHSIYSGRFFLSNDGKTIAILNPTIRSQTLFVWRDGKLIKLDYICPHKGPSGECIGTGSFYTDNDPVAISPDGEEVIAFFIVDPELRAYRYKIKGGGVFYSTILKVPMGSYIENACYNKKDWQYTEVVGNPLWTEDKKFALFIGSNSVNGKPCGGYIKPKTDILKIELKNIGDGTPIVEEELIKVTNNPEGDISQNIQISAMDISPQNKFIIFRATPHLQIDGTPIPDISSRQLTDKELYIIGIDGEGFLQLTNSLDFSLETLMAVKTPYGF